MFFPTLYLIFIIGGIIPVYVLFWMYYMMKRPHTMVFLKLIFLFTIVVAIFCASMIHLQSYSALAGTVPTLLEFPVHVVPLSIQHVVIPEEFHHFNPSVVRVDHGRHYLLALREGDFNNCPSKEQYPKINVFSFNRVLIGVGTHRDGPFRLTKIIEKPYDEHGGRLQGYEDARFIPLGDLDENGEAINQIGIVIAHQHQLLLFKYNLNFNDNETDVLIPVEKEYNVQLLGSRATDKQKNWMFIPPLDSRTGDHPRFVQWINPLTVVEMNTTGTAHVIHKEPYIPCIMPKVHGSTNFLREPSNPHKLFGLVHIRYDTYSFVAVPYYDSAIIEIEESEDSSSYRVIGMSKNFRFPSSDGNTKAHRIHFPMSMMYTDETKSMISISMGYMDCTAHAITVKTEDFLNSINGFIC